MALKKNDKIIITLGIVVFILAGVGIVMYTQPEKTTTHTSTETGMKTYEPRWFIQSGSTDISEAATKTAPYEGTTTISHGNLKSITFNLTWTDNRALLGRFGLDTLTL